MPVVRRPVPLSEELLDLPMIAILGGGRTTLLGRTAPPVPAGFEKKVPAAAAAVAGGALAEAPSGTPGSFQHLLTPLAAVASWCFTPLATPSPSSRFSVFEKLCGSLVTPGAARAAAALARSLASPTGVLAGSLSVDVPSSPGGTVGTASVAESEAAAAAMADVALREEDDEEDPSDEEDDDDASEDTPEAEHVAPRCENAPKPPPGALHPSRGSAGHATGTCKLCCFFPRGRCANGYDCGFCHYEHAKRKRKAKKSGKKAGGTTTLAISSAHAHLGQMMPSRMGGLPMLTAPCAGGGFMPPMATSSLLAYTSPAYMTAPMAGPPMMQLVHMPGGGCCFVQQPQMLVAMQPQDHFALAGVHMAHMPPTFASAGAGLRAAGGGGGGGGGGAGRRRRA